MIPPFLAAAVAKPGIKWGAIGGAVAILVAVTNWWTYDAMRTKCEDEKRATMAEHSAAVSRQALQGAEMAAAVAGTVDQQGQTLAAQVTAIERKVETHATQRPSCWLDPDVVQLLDEYARLLNATAHDLPTAPGGPGEPEVPGGRVADQASPIVQDNDPVTLSELNQYVADVVEQYGRMKIKYRGLSEFDDQRLSIERQAVEGR